MKYVSFILISFFLFGCDSTQDTKIIPPLAPSDLIEHSQEFEKQVISVSEKIHVAIGYSLANSIMVEAEEGKIIIDTTGTIETGREVRSLFDRLNPYPIKAVIYTHNHGDHVFGARAFVDNSETEVIAHETTEEYINRILGILRPIINKRSSRMFGSFFPEEAIENNGIGPFLEIGREGRQTSLVYPTKTFDESLELSISGLYIQLFHAPGETNDQIFVWIPKYKALFPGDNFYRAFPNLYTIRGTPYRDLAGWVKSIDMMRYLEPDLLIPSHSKPIKGAKEIRKHLTDYRDAIQFVHDQTVRLINKGMTPDQIANQIQLPEHLKSSPFLKEFYGTPQWSSKNVFTGYLGWFDGNPSTLNPVSEVEEAERIIKLSGGRSKVFSEAKKSLDEKDYQWALQLTDYLLLDDPSDVETKKIRTSALNFLGEMSANPNARYYYLSSAAELLPTFKEPPLLTPTKETIENLPIEIVFEILKVNLIPEQARDKNLHLSIKFTDSLKSFSLILRNGVLEVQPFEIGGSSVQIETDEVSWKEVVTGNRSLPVSMATGLLSVTGDRVSLINFFNSFRE
ncbi:MAG TPA: MBL fold metallo-hydrolase [Gammaproteobacteria bacterium]|nr:MBL fold metallo-hydrolase [Gammaproteobacteria bacterium]